MQPAPDREGLRLALTRLRAERNLTYDELSGVSGVARVVLVNIETGRTLGSIQTWHRIAHALDMPFGELMQHACDDHP